MCVVRISMFESIFAKCTMWQGSLCFLIQVVSVCNLFERLKIGKALSVVPQHLSGWLVSYDVMCFSSAVKVLSDKWRVRDKFRCHCGFF